jgi:leucyl/phenylalanyl-tRNA---protein transferase
MSENFVIFPDPSEATEEGLLCVGGNLNVQTLLSAYSKGIFPWPQVGYPLLWFSPPKRGVIDFSDLHISKSLKKELRDDHEITFDTAFTEVIRECAVVPRSHESGTWILPEMQEAYSRFHRAGHAHSVELWDSSEGDRKLVGGLYGVFVRGVFSGESMFYKKDNASKICLLALIQRLRASGISWMDTQMVTPVVEQLGGKYIEREQFLERLKNSSVKLVVDWKAPWTGFEF